MVINSYNTRLFALRWQSWFLSFYCKISKYQHLTLVTLTDIYSRRKVWGCPLTEAMETVSFCSIESILQIYSIAFLHIVLSRIARWSTNDKKPFLPCHWRHLELSIIWFTYMAVLKQISIVLAGPRSAASSRVAKEGSVCNRLHPSVVSCCSLSHCTETNQQPQQQLWKWKMKWKTQCMFCISLTPCFERSRNAALFLGKKRWKWWAPMREKFLSSVKSWRITTPMGVGWSVSPPAISW